MLDHVGELESANMCSATCEVAMMLAQAGRLTLEIRHEGLSARIERVDDHLPVRRAGDLDSSSYNLISKQLWTCVTDTAL